MNEFVLLYRGDKNAFAAWPENRPQQEIDAIRKRWRAWFDRLAAEGALKTIGVPLQYSGKHVVSNGTITDGPFAEGKEIVGGFSVVNASTIEEAAKLAAGCPIIAFGGAVEVRPLQPM